MSGMNIEPLRSAADADWLALRMALWPDGTVQAHLDEMAGFLDEPARFAQFIARDDDGRALGFVEASIRSDYVNGTEHSPVAFLEGLYVVPAARRDGVARDLVAAVSAWATARGCRELASDALIDNTLSHDVHRSLGFIETERVVYFLKRLG
jgi:aminoglycoside 6'-N-acetyltransferase I